MPVKEPEKDLVPSRHCMRRVTKLVDVCDPALPLFLGIANPNCQTFIRQKLWKKSHLLPLPQGRAHAAWP